MEVRKLTLDISIGGEDAKGLNRSGLLTPWAILELTDNFSLDEFHDLMCEVFGWTGQYIHSFRSGNLEYFVDVSRDTPYASGFYRIYETDDDDSTPITRRTLGGSHKYIRESHNLLLGNLDLREDSTFFYNACSESDLYSIITVDRCLLSNGSEKKIEIIDCGNYVIDDDFDMIEEFISGVRKKEIDLQYLEKKKIADRIKGRYK